MSEPEFNISLGGGLYMDSNGDVRSGPSPAAPTYPLPGGGVLPITKEAFEEAITGTTKALQGVAKVLPDPWDQKKDPDREDWMDQESVKRLLDLGVPEGTIEMLASFGGVAARFAKVIPIVGAIVVILEEFFKFFSSSGPSRMELLMEAHFAGVHTHLKADEMQAKLILIRDSRVVISNAMTQLNEYLDELRKLNPSLVELQRTRGNILEVKENVAVEVEKLLSYNTWLFVYLPDSFKWATWLGELLHVMPAGSPPPPPKPAESAQAYNNRFEHGMMVPTVIHGLQNYLMLIKALIPEYRSTGAYDTELRKFTVLLEELTKAMRERTLARTIYPIGPHRPFIHTFQTDLPARDVIDPGLVAPYVAPGCPWFPVGAIDLCSFTDAFYQQQHHAAIAAGTADPMYGPPVVGTMNVRWIPPATLEPTQSHAPEIYYRVTNPDECAAAANAQSEVDYARLLLSSGYLNLVQMTTLMRHLATEPDQSETVTGDVILLRNPLQSTDVTVKSEDIIFSGEITSPASREPAECRAIVPLSTQPHREVGMLPYRIVLRTLRSILPSNHWRGPDYADYYSTLYENDPDNAGFLRLVAEANDAWALDEHELASGTSPEELVLVQPPDGVQMKAHTFDWYVPVDALFLSDDRLATALRSEGWSRPKRPPIPQKTHGGGNPFGNPLQPSTLTYADKLAIVDTHLFSAGPQDWEGQRRDMKETDVVIKYTLQWKGERLRISLENRPEDRNYIVFLVVEETLPTNGQILHTALPVPMNGQLTYVRRKFFDDERAAIDKANRIVLDIASRYAESGPVGPEDPFIRQIRPGNLYSAVGMRRLVDLAERHQPMLVRQAVARYEASSGLVKGDVPHSRD